MSALANLKLVAAKRSVQLSPVVQRRNKVAKRIWEQIQLATAKQDGKSYAPTKQRTVTEEVAPFLRTDSVGFLSEPSAVTSYPRGCLPKVPLDRRRAARWITQRSSCCQLYCR